MEVVTHGGGEALYYIFNGVAMITNGSSYADLIIITTAFAFIWLGFKTSFNLSSFRENAIWFGGYLIFYQSLLIPKTTLTITDKYDATYTASVDNVPYGLAVLVQYTSSIGNGMAELFDQSFSLPNDLDYSSSGFLMGSQIVRDMSRIRIRDAEFSSNMDEFIQQCVFGDINAVNKYTYDDLKTSGAIWDLVTENPSDTMMFEYSDDGVSTVTECSTGVSLLEAEWETEISSQLVYEYKKKFGDADSDAIAESYMSALLETSNSFLMGLSDDSSTTLRQKLMINAIEDSTINMSDYAEVVTAIETRNSFERAASQATRWIPLARTTIEAILYGVFPFIFLLFLMPMGIKIFTNYVQALIWLQAWPPLYAILHLIVSLSHKNALTYADNSVTLGTIDDIEEVHNDISMIAGYMMLMIPFLATKLLQGFSGIGHMLGSITGALQGASATATSEMTRGNYSLGNSNLDNHSFNNLSANKHDTRTSIQEYGATFQQPDGTQITSYQGGRTTIDTSATHDHFKTNIDSISSISTAIKDEMTEARTLGESSEKMAQSSLSSTFDTVSEMGKQYSQAKESANSWAYSLDSNTQRAFETINSLSETASKGTEINTTAGLETSAGVNLPFIGGANASMGASGSISGNINSNRELQESLRESLDVINRASQEGRFNLSDSEGNSLNERLNSSYSEYQSYSDTAAIHYNRSDTLSQMHQQSKDHSFSVKTDDTSHFVDYLRSEGNNNEEIISIMEDPDRIEIRDKLIEEYNDHIVEQYAQEYGFDLERKISNEEYISRSKEFEENHANSVIDRSDEVNDKFTEIKDEQIQNSHLQNKVNTSNKNNFSRINHKELPSDKLDAIQNKLENNKMLQKLNDKDS